MNEENINEIGKIARILDTEMTIIERMKIKKTAMTKITFALVFYAVVMSFFSIFL